MSIRKQENSKRVKRKTASRQQQESREKRRTISKTVKSERARSKAKVKEKKTTTFVTKRNTNKSLFPEKVNEANALLSKVSFINKRAAAAG